MVGMDSLREPFNSLSFNGPWDNFNLTYLTRDADNSCLTFFLVPYPARFLHASCLSLNDDGMQFATRISQRPDERRTSLDGWIARHAGFDVPIDNL